MKRTIRRIVLTTVCLLMLLGVSLCAAASGFSDVNPGAYYAEAVRWAVNRGITSGTSATTFSPNTSCTLAEAVTFLWRFDDSPHFGKEINYSDIAASDYFFNAVRWAVDRGITAGASNTQFAPNAACTRAQVVTFLWRYAGQSEASGSMPFQDVPPKSIYAKAVLWAARNGITSGTSETTFSPQASCTRAQLVTMLYKLSTVLPAKKLVVLDPGHQRQGNYDKEPNGPGSLVMKAKCSSGTYGPTSKLYEYQLNLTVSFQLREALERRGYRVLMTRESHDVNLSNIQRAKFANNAGADVAIRIHANGNTNTALYGAETVCLTRNNPYCKSIYTRSRALSDAIINHLCAKTGAKNKGVWETDTMTGINWSTVPVTIVEMGYMSNPTEDQNMATASYQKKIVAGICDGVDEYFANNG